MDTLSGTLLLSLLFTLGIAFGAIALLLRGIRQSAVRNKVVREMITDRLAHPRSRQDCEELTRMYCEMALSLIGQAQIVATQDLIWATMDHASISFRIIGSTINEQTLRTAIAGIYPALLELHRRHDAAASQLLGFYHGHRAVEHLGLALLSRKERAI